MRLHEVIRATLTRFGDRPALAERHRLPRSNVELESMQRQSAAEYDFLTFSELWDRVVSVASQLSRRRGVGRPLNAGDRVAFLGFPSVDYVTVDLACNLVGLTTVPLQTSASAAQQEAILAETAPRALVVSVHQLDRAAQLVRPVSTLERLVVIDYRGGTASHVEGVERLVEAANQDAVRAVETPDFSLTGDLPVPKGDPDSNSAMLLFTSGSTGSPKGAIYTERLVREMWGGEGWSDFFAEDQTVSTFHYMPMSHVAGHSSVRGTLARGGITYFASTTDLSSFFDDVRLARPTELSLVPRVCELIFQEHQRLFQVARSRPGDRSEDEVAAIVDKEIREEVLGGRVRWASCTSAPVSEDLRKFIERVLGIDLHVLYGTTEIGGVLADGRFLQPPVVDYRLEDVPDLGYFTSDVPEARGELLIKSSSTVPGYFNRPELTQEVFTADGYYRTGDIAAVDQRGRVRIIDRKNAIIKLSQGEFIALPSLEATYATSPKVRQVFLHGESSRSYLIALVVPTDEVVQRMVGGWAELVEEYIGDFRRIAAQEGLNSYEIPRGVILEPEPFSESNGLLSDHRKVLRPEVLRRYGARFAEMYGRLDASSDALLRELRRNGATAPTLTTLLQAVGVALGGSVVAMDAEARFRDLGGDSLSAVHLTQLIEQIYGVPVPVDVVVSESYTLRRLAAYIGGKRAGTVRTVSAEEVHGADAGMLRAKSLSLSHFLRDPIPIETDRRRPQRIEPQQVLLTGASGYLGRVLCLEWLKRLAPAGGRLVCVVRAVDDAAAFARLRRSYQSDERMLREFDDLAGNLEVVAGDLSEQRLGLSDDIWERMTRDIDLVVHAGAMVNHVLPYRNLFAPNVVGTAEIVKLSLTGKQKAINFLSSVATATLDGPASPLDEYADIRRALSSVPPDGAYAAGYAASKWAGEVLLREAHEQYGVPVTVFRASMILAHSSYHGQVNVPDSFTRLLYSVLRTGIAPASFYREGGPQPHYDGLPVDVMASAMVALGARIDDQYATYHVVNPLDDGVSLDQMIDWIVEDGIQIERISDYDEWRRRFEKALHALPEAERRASMTPLLHSLAEPEQPVSGSLIDSTRFLTALRAEKGPVQAVLHGLDRAYILKYVRDLEQVFGFLATRRVSEGSSEAG